MKTFPAFPHSKAFTLAELLLVITTLAILAVLLLPVSSRVMEHTRTTTCLQRLRQVGVILHGLAAENQGKLHLFRDGSALGNLRWYNQAKVYTGLSEPEAKKAFSCPSMTGGLVGDWYCYGVRAGGSPGKRVQYEVPSGKTTAKAGIYELTVASVEEPGHFLMAADSVNQAGNQTFRIAPPGFYSDTGIQVRHRGRANALFLDGRVASLDLEELAKAGISQVLDKDIQTLQIKTLP